MLFAQANVCQSNETRIYCIVSFDWFQLWICRVCRHNIERVWFHDGTMGFDSHVCLNLEIHCPIRDDRQSMSTPWSKVTDAARIFSYTRPSSAIVVKNMSNHAHDRLFARIERVPEIDHFLIHKWHIALLLWGSSLNQLRFPCMARVRAVDRYNVLCCSLK